MKCEDGASSCGFWWFQSTLQAVMRATASDMNNLFLQALMVYLAPNFHTGVCPVHSCSLELTAEL